MQQAKKKNIKLRFRIKGAKHLQREIIITY